MEGDRQWRDRQEGGQDTNTGQERGRGKTLSLKLEEVKHIRSVLSKAKLEVKIY